MRGVSVAPRGRRTGRSWLMSAEEENKGLALTVLEALNARDLDPWSQKLADDYAAEYPGVPTLNKTQSFGYNQRFVIAFPDTHFKVHSVVSQGDQVLDRKSTRLNSSHANISYAVFCLKKNTTHPNISYTIFCF